VRRRSVVARDERRKTGPIGKSVRIGLTRNVDRKLRFYERGNPYVGGPKGLREWFSDPLENIMARLLSLMMGPIDIETRVDAGLERPSGNASRITRAVKRRRRMAFSPTKPYMLCVDFDPAKEISPSRPYNHRSTSTSPDGLEQQISKLPAAGGSSGSG
jgi:hypothetical protein